MHAQFAGGVGGAGPDGDGPFAIEGEEFAGTVADGVEIGRGGRIREEAEGAAAGATGTGGVDGVAGAFEPPLGGQLAIVGFGDGNDVSRGEAGERVGDLEGSPVGLEDGALFAGFAAGEDMEDGLVPEAGSAGEPIGVIGEAVALRVADDDDGAINEALETGVHEDVGGQLFGAPGGPDAEIEADAGDIAEGGGAGDDGVDDVIAERGLGAAEADGEEKEPHAARRSSALALPPRRRRKMLCRRATLRVRS